MCSSCLAYFKGDIEISYSYLSLHSGSLLIIDKTKCKQNAVQNQIHAEVLVHNCSSWKPDNSFHRPVGERALCCASCMTLMLVHDNKVTHKISTWKNGSVLPKTVFPNISALFRKLDSNQYAEDTATTVQRILMLLSLFRIKRLQRKNLHKDMSNCKNNLELLHMQICQNHLVCKHFQSFWLRDKTETCNHGSNQRSVSVLVTLSSSVLFI